MHTFILPASILIAINRYATSTEETRYYLNGVCVQVRDGKGFMVATDGHKLLVAPFDAGVSSDGEYIIPRPLLAKLKLARKSEENVTVEIEERKVTLTHDNTSYIGQVIDGSFPDWPRVIPSSQSGEFAQFNGAYVKDMDDAAKLIGTVAYLGLNGNNPAWVDFASGEMFGVLMPKTKDATVTPRRADWL